jgi:integrase
MPIYQRGNGYQVSVGSGAGRWRKNFKTLAEAEKAEKLQLLVHEGIIDTPHPHPSQNGSPAKKIFESRTLGDAFKLTVRDTWGHQRSDSGPRQARVVLRMLGEDTPVADITTTVIREMVEELVDAGAKGTTVNHKLSALSMMLKTAADEGWIENLPRIKRRTAGGHRIKWLNAQEELELLNACQALGLVALKDFVTVAIDTGFRRTELLLFQVKEYRDGMLHLHPDQTKTAKPRAVPATSRVHEILKRRSKNDRLFDDLTASKLRSQWEVVREHLGKLDDPQYVVHMLRHTCASRLAMQDKPAQFIQAWMGHATPITTARYMHLCPTKLREGKSALEAFCRTAV